MRQMRMPQHNLNLTVGTFSAGVTLGLRCARSEVARGPQNLGGRVRRQLLRKRRDSRKKKTKTVEGIRDIMAELVAHELFPIASNLLTEWFV